jgi:hypothetical protein
MGDRTVDELIAHIAARVAGGKTVTRASGKRGWRAL